MVISMLLLKRKRRSVFGLRALDQGLCSRMIVLGMYGLTGRRQWGILTENDYSRKVVGGQIVEEESGWDHLSYP
jgi:hypothetical protein